MEYSPEKAVTEVIHPVVDEVMAVDLLLLAVMVVVLLLLLFGILLSLPSSFCGHGFNFENKHTTDEDFVQLCKVQCERRESAVHAL